MRNWVLTLIGGLLGGAVGLCLLFLPGEKMPGMISIPVEGISTFLRRVFMPNSDPMAAFVIAMPVMVFYCAILGGLVGFSIQLITALFRKISTKGFSG